MVALYIMVLNSVFLLIYTVGKDITFIFWLGEICTGLDTHKEL